MTTSALTSTKYKNAWPPALPLELALEVHSYDEIAEAHGLDRCQLDLLFENPSFRKEYILAKKEVADTGRRFQMRAAAQAEHYMAEVIDPMMVDMEVPPSVKADLWKSLVKFGRLEPPKDSGADAGSGQNNAFNIQIVLNS